MDGQTHKLLHRLDWTHTIEAGPGTANTHLEQWIENERTNGWCWWWIWLGLDHIGVQQIPTTFPLVSCVCMWMYGHDWYQGLQWHVASGLPATNIRWLYLWEPYTTTTKKEVMLWQQGTTQAVANNFCLDTSFQIYGFSQPAGRLGSRQSCNN